MRLLRWVIIGFGIALCLPDRAAALVVTERVTNNTIATADWQPPQTTLTLQRGGREIPIKEQIVNGDFQYGTNGWSGDQISANSESNNPYVVLDRHDNPLAQTIPNTGGYLTFRYNVFTQEVDPGFDEPAFVTTINGKEVFRVDAQNIAETTGWQTFGVDLAQFPDTSLTIQFSAGNTGDDLYPSWAYLDDVSTNVIISNGELQAVLRGEDNDRLQRPFTFAYRIGNHAPVKASTITLNADLPLSALEFWATDASGNQEYANNIPLDVDLEPPEPPHQPMLFRETPDELRLTFEAPQDNLFDHISAYAIRALPPAPPINITIKPEQAPLAPGAFEQLFLSPIPPHTNLELVAVDAAGNRSDPIEASEQP